MFKRLFLFSTFIICLPAHAWQFFSPYSGKPSFTKLGLAAGLYALPAIKEKLLKSGLVTITTTHTYKTICPPAPRAIQNMTRDLCKKVGVNFSDIEVVYDKDPGLDIKFAIAVWDHFVVLGSKFLTLPKNQQKAILAHELIHIKHKDNKSRNQMSGSIKTALPVIAATEAIAYGVHHSCFWLERQAKTHQWNRTEKWAADIGEKIPSILTHPLYQLFAICMYDWAKYHQKYYILAQSQEKRADLESAQLAGTGAGMIDFLKNILSKHGEEPAWQQSTLEHPRISTRIAYLKKEVAKLGTSK